MSKILEQQTSHVQQGIKVRSQFRVQGLMFLFFWGGCSTNLVSWNQWIKKKLWQKRRKAAEVDYVVGCCFGFKNPAILKKLVVKKLSIGRMAATTVKSIKLRVSSPGLQQMPAMLLQHQNTCQCSSRWEPKLRFIQVPKLKVSAWFWGAMLFTYVILSTFYIIF